MASNAKPINAQRTSIDGINFDSIYESTVYEILRGKVLRMENPSLRISIHPPVHFTGGENLSQVCSNPSWKVDFLIVDVSQGNTPICGIEAKGRFFPQDTYKFLLWDLYQKIPLMVVYQGTKPVRLLSNGWLTFLPTAVFRSLDLEKQIDYKIKTKTEANGSRR